ncbi:MAG: hypothetical protein JXR91_17630 [Deltaproteobacteria bacterium]|nr:hypothetical protein [Deltaproteobacteria bacterium]
MKKSLISLFLVIVVIVVIGGAGGVYFFQKESATQSKLNEQKFISLMEKIKALNSSLNAADETRHMQEKLLAANEEAEKIEAAKQEELEARKKAAVAEMKAVEQKIGDKGERYVLADPLEEYQELKNITGLHVIDDEKNNYVIRLLEVEERFKVHTEPVVLYIVVENKGADKKDDVLIWRLPDENMVATVKSVKSIKNGMIISAYKFKGKKITSGTKISFQVTFSKNSDGINRELEILN